MREDETYRQERPVVYLIGIGMGGEDQLTGQAIDRLDLLPKKTCKCYRGRQKVFFSYIIYK